MRPVNCEILLAASFVLSNNRRYLWKCHSSLDFLNTLIASISAEHSSTYFYFQDKLLNTLEDSEPELATTQEEEVLVL